MFLLADPKTAGNCETLVFFHWFRVYYLLLNLDFFQKNQELALRFWFHRRVIFLFKNGTVFLKQTQHGRPYTTETRKQK